MADTPTQLAQATRQRATYEDGEALWAARPAADRLPPPGGDRRNFALGVINGALFTTGMVFIGRDTVIPAYVTALSGSRLAVGLAAAIFTAGWPLPQLFAARYMRRHAHAMRFYRMAGGIRCLCLLPAVFSAIFIAPRSPQVALAVFLAAWAGFALAGGVGSLAFTEIVARTVPAQRRSSFFSQRLLWGSVGSLAAGWLVRRILSPSGALVFPYDYALMFALAWLLTTMAILVFMLVREPPLPPVPRREPLWRYLRGGMGLLRADVGYRRYLATLTLSGSHQMAVPFYTVFLLQHLTNEAGQLLGLFIAAQVLGGMASNLLWGRLGDSQGSRAVLRGSIAATALVPACALWVGRIMPGAGVGEVSSTVGWLGGLLFMLLGVANAGSGISGTTYLLDLSPVPRRTTYIGLTNTFTSLYGLYPILGALLADLWGIRVLFAATLALQLFASVAASWLPHTAGDKSAV